MFTRRKARESMYACQGVQDNGEASEYETTYESEQDNDRTLVRQSVTTSSEADHATPRVSRTSENKHAGHLSTSVERSIVGTGVTCHDDNAAPVYDVTLSSASQEPTNSQITSLSSHSSAKTRDDDVEANCDNEMSGVEFNNVRRRLGDQLLNSDLEGSVPSDAETMILRNTVTGRVGSNVHVDPRLIRNQTATRQVRGFEQPRNVVVVNEGENSQTQVIRNRETTIRSSSHTSNERARNNAVPPVARAPVVQEARRVGSAGQADRENPNVGFANTGNRAAGDQTNTDNLLKDPATRAALLQAILREERNNQTGRPVNATVQTNNETTRPQNGRSTNQPIRETRERQPMRPPPRWVEANTDFDTEGTEDSTEYETTDVEDINAGLFDDPDYECRARQFRSHKQAIRDHAAKMQQMSEWPASVIEGMDREYAATGRVLLKHRVPGDERKYWDEEYMDSPSTDASSDYSTEQEDSETAMRRLRGFHLPGEMKEWRFTPMRKYQRVRKHVKRRLKHKGMQYKRPARVYDAPYKPVIHKTQSGAIRANPQQPNGPNLESARLEYQQMTDGDASTRHRNEETRDRPNAVSRFPKRRGDNRAYLSSTIDQTAAQSGRLTNDEMTNHQMPIRRSTVRELPNQTSAIRQMPVQRMVSRNRETSNPRSLEPPTVQPSNLAFQQMSMSHNEHTRIDDQQVRPLPVPTIRSAPTSSITLAPGVVLTTSEANTTNMVDQGNAGTTINIIGKQTEKRGSGDFRIQQPIFNGGNWTTFKNQFERMAKYSGWSDEQKATALHLAIKDKAADALCSAETIDWTYDELVAHMEQRHGKTKSWVDAMTEVYKIRRHPGQSLSSYNDQITKMLSVARLTPTEARELAYTAFVHGLQGNPKLVKRIHAAQVNTIQKALNIAMKFEEDEGDTSISMPHALHVHMVAGAEDDSADKPGTIATAIKRSNIDSHNATTQVANIETHRPANQEVSNSQLCQQIQQMSDRVDKRFDAFDRRVRNLEGRPAPPPQEGRFNNNGNRTNNQGFRDKGNRGFQNNGYQNDRRPGFQGQQQRNNQFFRRNDDYRQNQARPAQSQDNRRPDMRGPNSGSSQQPQAATAGSQSRQD